MLKLFGRKRRIREGVQKLLDDAYEVVPELYDEIFERVQAYDLEGAFKVVSRVNDMRGSSMTALQKDVFRPDVPQSERDLILSIYEMGEKKRSTFISDWIMRTHSLGPSFLLNPYMKKRNMQFEKITM